MGLGLECYSAIFREANADELTATILGCLPWCVSTEHAHFLLAASFLFCMNELNPSCGLPFEGLVGPNLG